MTPNRPNAYDSYGNMTTVSSRLLSRYSPNDDPFSAEERQSLKVPMMFAFGKRDNPVGDPEVARELVQDILNVRVEIVEAGHLMGAELPDQVNTLVMEFFEEE